MYRPGLGQVQRLRTGRARLAEGGEHEPDGQACLAAGIEQQQCTERGVLPGDLDSKLDGRTYPDRFDVLMIPRLLWPKGATSATETKPNIVLNVDFCPDR